jgi:hypothetical protein
MSYEYRQLGLIGLYQPEDLVDFTVHIAEVRCGIVQIPIRYQVGYKCLRHVAKKHGVYMEDIEIEEYYGNMSFYASLLRFHDSEWIPPLLESAWREYEKV